MRTHTLRRRSISLIIMSLAAGLVIWAGCGQQNVTAPSSTSGDSQYAPMGKGGNKGGGGAATDTTVSPPDTTQTENGGTVQTQRVPGDGTGDW